MDEKRKNEIAVEVKPLLEDSLSRMGGMQGSSTQDGPFIGLAVKIVGQAIMKKYSLTKSDATEVLIQTGVLPASVIRKASGS